MLWHASQALIGEAPICKMMSSDSPPGPTPKASSRACIAHIPQNSSPQCMQVSPPRPSGSNPGHPGEAHGSPVSSTSCAPARRPASPARMNSINARMAPYVPRARVSGHFRGRASCGKGVVQIVSGQPLCATDALMLFREERGPPRRESMQDLEGRRAGRLWQRLSSGRWVDGLSSSQLALARGSCHRARDWRSGKPTLSAGTVTGPRSGAASSRRTRRVPGRSRGASSRR